MLKSINSFNETFKKLIGKSVIWDKQLICPVCHHCSLVQPALSKHPGVPPVCVHCGFKVPIKGFNPRAMGGSQNV